MAAHSKEFDDVLHAHGYLQAPDASEAVAGIALVAAKVGGKGILPAKLSSLPAQLGPLPEKLPGLALKALLRIRGEDSELNEMWQESEDFADWVKTLDDIEAALMRVV